MSDTEKVVESLPCSLKKRASELYQSLRLEEIEIDVSFQEIIREIRDSRK